MLPCNGDGTMVSLSNRLLSILILIFNVHEAQAQCLRETMKKGIGSLSLEKKQEISLKGNTKFLQKWENEEFRELHRRKVKLGKLAARLKKLKPYHEFGL